MVTAAVVERAQVRASPRAYALIREYEGCAVEPYADAGGWMTIGFGHRLRDGERFAAPIPIELCESLLAADVQRAEECIARNVTVELTQNQVDALISWIYNLGCGRFQYSALLRYLNAGDYIAAGHEFTRWSHVGKRVLPGLLRRRIAEQMLFTSPRVS